MLRNYARSVFIFLKRPTLTAYRCTLRRLAHFICLMKKNTFDINVTQSIISFSAREAHFYILLRKEGIVLYHPLGKLKRFKKKR